MNKQELLSKLEDAEIKLNGFELESAYHIVYDVAQELYREDLVEEFIDYDMAEEILRNEIDNGGLARAWHFLNDLDYFNDELFRLNAYGNLSNIEFEDIEYIIAELREEIKE